MSEFLLFIAKYFYNNTNFAKNNNINDKYFRRQVELNQNSMKTILLMNKKFKLI